MHQTHASLQDRSCNVRAPPWRRSRFHEAALWSSVQNGQRRTAGWSAAIPASLQGRTPASTDGFHCVSARVTIRLPGS